MAPANKLYLVSTAAFMLVLPVASVGVALVVGRGPADPWRLVGTWFVFWGLGARLLTAGVKQVTQPGFTAEHIFGITDRGSHVVVRELGFANVCMGLAGLASLWIPAWRTAAAFTGGLYFGIAGVMHVVKGAATANERVALASDLFIFAVLAAWLAHAAR